MYPKPISHARRLRDLHPDQPKIRRLAKEIRAHLWVQEVLSRRSTSALLSSSDNEFPNLTGPLPREIHDLNRNRKRAASFRRAIQPTRWQH